SSRSPRGTGSTPWNRRLRGPGKQRHAFRSPTGHLPNTNGWPSPATFRQVATRYLPRRVLACVLLIAAVFAAMHALDYHKDVPSNDTYQYAKQTLRIIGHSPAQAIHEATVMFCEDGGPTTSTATDESGSGSTKPLTADQCLRAYRDGLTPDTPQYLAIFTSRPGYP